MKRTHKLFSVIMILSIIFYSATGLMFWLSRDNQQRCNPETDNCYQNPVLDLGSEQIGDPAVTFYDGIYYLVGTAPGHYANGQIKMWNSTDLVNWEEIGVVYQAALEPGDWNRYMFWAAEIFVNESDFYLSYSASHDETLQNHRIGIAHSNSITGPYTDIVERPIFNLDFEAIDQHIFGYNEKPYMMYTNHEGVDSIWLAELSPDMKNTIGEHVLLFERRSNENVCEAPWLYQKNGRFFILYSANGGNTPDYEINYYYADGLEGPYKYGGNLLEKAESIYGPGHCCVVKLPSGSQDYVIYQTKKNSEINWERHIAIDRININILNRLDAIGPTNTHQCVPN